MVVRNGLPLVALLTLVGLGACRRNKENPMQKCLESCYPGSGKTRYEIGFEWGTYHIHTTGPTAAEADDPNARYGGYIVARPEVAHPARGRRHWTYLVTPGGTVWRRLDDGSIPAAGRHKQVSRSTQGRVAASAASAIRSPAEPVIDDFLDHPSAWSRYGTLVAEGQDSYHLVHAPDGRAQQGIDSRGH